ncbi:metallophosphoesterase [Martelella alba]|uniref:Calcineurin-like phosphoesterase domain-containing protein n=1 Tax=Martelella alba TaxID=2590451 RepID=A0ABY2SNA9_9HYPH|nr:metallophosphoesterase [Martelella alba]TKI05181.1 hypothetical protein FCN80_14915 [Martelella alba]
MISALTPWQLRALGDVGALYQVPSFNETAEPGILRFGLIADPQYADADMSHGRYYRHSLRKLATAIAGLNEWPLDFVVTLGDLVDRDWQSFRAVQHGYQALRHPHVVVMGNHDAAVLSRRLADQHPPLGLPKFYFQFRIAGYRIIAIDGNDISLYCNPANGDDRQQAQRMLAQLAAEQKPQAQDWNGALSNRQLQWLETCLQDAQDCRETIVALGHYPLAPAGRHNLWNDETVAALLCRHRTRVYFAGHQHGGAYQRIADTDFITLKGMVDGEDTIPYAIVELRGREMTLSGHGPELSRILP